MERVGKVDVAGGRTVELGLAEQELWRFADPGTRSDMGRVVGSAKRMGITFAFFCRYQWMMRSTNGTDELEAILR